MSAPQKIRILYKAILRLHRSLPNELREMGDVYVKDEFRRFAKSSNSKDFMTTFVTEWTNYYGTLVKQIGKKGTTQKPFGKSLSDKLDELADQQVYQLYELKQAIESPTAVNSSQKNDGDGTKHRQISKTS